MAKSGRLGELSNVQLDRMFASHPDYLSATSKDHLPSAKLLDGHFVIVNLQSANAGPGTHWVLLYAADKRGNVTYFDPMGESAPPKEIARRMASLPGRKSVYNATDFQQYGSSSCGYWCAYAADFFAARGNSGITALYQLKSQFSPSDVKANEQKLYKHFY